MKIYFFFFLFFNSFLFPQDFLKTILFDTDLNFIKELDYPKVINLKNLNIKEGIIAHYPDGSPPLVYEFKGEDFKIIYEEKGAKKLKFNAKNCETLEKINGFFKISPKKEVWGFPLEKKYYFILIKEKGEVYLREGEYSIEDLNGNWYFPEFLNLEKIKEILLYPSFKSQILVQNDKGLEFEKCRSIINLDIPEFGKSCKKFKKDYIFQETKYDLIFPSKGKASFKINCENTFAYRNKFQTKEINNPFIITLNLLSSIEGYLKDKDDEPIPSYELSLFSAEDIYPLKTTTTDKNGYFKFANLKEGVYYLKDVPPFEFFAEKNITIKTKSFFYGILGSEDFNILVRDEPEGTYIFEEIKLKEGERANLNLILEKPKIWEGKIISELNYPIASAKIYYKEKVLAETGDDGKFKIEYRGDRLKNVFVSAEGYSSQEIKEIDLENPPDTIVLKGMGTFKVMIESEIDSKILVANISNSFKFLKLEEGNPMIIFKLEKSELFIEATLPEGYYRLEITKPFKHFISDEFLIQSGKEYDYGRIYLNLEERDEKEKKEIKFFVKDSQGNPAPYTTISFSIALDIEKTSFSSITQTGEDGYFTFVPESENFRFLFLYCNGEKGFIFLDERDLERYNGSSLIEVVLNPANELKIKILNLPKKDRYGINLTAKNIFIKTEILYGEEKTFKNLSSPINLQISSAEEILWKEIIELKEGENKLEI